MQISHHSILISGNNSHHNWGRPSVWPRATQWVVKGPAPEHAAQIWICYTPIILPWTSTLRCPGRSLKTASQRLPAGVKWTGFDLLYFWCKWPSVVLLGVIPRTQYLTLQCHPIAAFYWETNEGVKFLLYTDQFQGSFSCSWRVTSASGCF